MTSVKPSDETVTREQLLVLIASMNNKQLALWYDIGRTIQTRLTPATSNQDITDDDDWLNDTEEQIAAEDALWDATTAKYSENLSRLGDAIANSPSLPMFGPDGRWLLDDYTEADFETATPHDPSSITCPEISESIAA